MKKLSATIAAVLLTSIFIFGGVLGAPSTAFAVSPPNSPSSDVPTGPALGTCGIKTPAGTTQNMPNLITQTACTQLSGTWTVDPSGRTEEVTAKQAAGQPTCGVIGPNTSILACVTIIPGIVATSIILPIVSFVTSISGVLLNQVIDQTVVNMASSFNNPAGIGGAITSVWGTVRDIANMTFIFILLYTAIKTMFGSNEYKSTIKNIVIAAVLVNFSLFFTKLIIDAGNLLALTFYGAVAPGALAVGHTAFNTGLSNALMDRLHITSIWGGGLNGNSLLSIGLLGSAVAIISAIVFFAISIMFIIRFVVLILVLCLSPLMFIGSVIPGVGGYGKQWMQTLMGQTFFAPVFFFMMWITLRFANVVCSLSSSAEGVPNAACPNDFAAALTSTVTAGKLSVTPGAFSIFLNFGMVITFLIASLVVAKQVSGKSAKAVGTMTNWATGFASNRIVGGSLRETVGRGGSILASNANLIKAANEKTGLAGAASRLALYAGRKAGSGSFDIKSATIPTAGVSDLVRGTLGRTKLGKAIGADEFDTIHSVEVGNQISKLAGLSPGGTKGFTQQSAEDEKKWSKIKDEQKQEYDVAKAKIDIEAGIKSGATTGPTIDAMEKAIGKMSDKQVEAMVADNKKLLESQLFANKISVQQLDALNKSDKLSDSDKETLKTERFATINTAMAAGTPATVAGQIKGLSDTELEMIDPDHLKDEGFVSQLRPAQIDAVNKSKRFTSTQKKALKDARNGPLFRAVDTSLPGYAPSSLTVKDYITKKLTPKDVAGLMGTNITLPGGTVGSLLTHPDVLSSLTVGVLKKMALEMTGGDVTTLRAALLAPGAPTSTAVNTWLTNPATASEFS